MIDGESAGIVDVEYLWNAVVDAPQSHGWCRVPWIEWFDLPGNGRRADRNAEFNVSGALTRRYVEEPMDAWMCLPVGDHLIAPWRKV